MIKSFQNLALVIALIIFSTLISPDLAQAGELGGINMGAYCKTTFGEEFGRAFLVEHTAWGWRCSSRTSVAEDINVHDACRQQYRDSRAYAQAKNPNDPFSWVCLVDDDDDQIEW